MLFQSRSIMNYVFIALAVAIAAGSLWVSHKLAKDLSREERNKMEIWAAATQQLVKVGEDTDMSLVLKVLQSNTTIPVILYDENSGELSANNIELPAANAKEFLIEKKELFAQKHEPIALPELNQYLYYDDSLLLKRLQVYPSIQLAVFAVFIALAFFALRSAQRAEQNNVWVGLSKETAHQLGTPLSSLAAWLEYLKLSSPDNAHVQEIEKDIVRLNRIADRFSKIGSAPDLRPAELQGIVERSVAYLRKRISEKVEIVYDFPEKPLQAHVNEALFGWVIENLTKNAVDAMNGQGRITYSLVEKGDFIHLDISDTGKGIPKSKHRAVFSPGFTTKERGWGLGLSLAKRIVETYHKGKIFVKSSEMGKGTTFRIVLRSACNETKSV